MSRRLLIRTISFLVVSLIILTIMTVQNINRSNMYKQVVAKNYNYAFSELLSSMTKMDYALRKSAYSTDNSMLCSLCSEIFREAEISSHAISRLPIADLPLENVIKFITRVGDYSYYLARKTARNEKISLEERRNIDGFIQGIDGIIQSLYYVSENLNDKTYNLRELVEEGDYSLFDDITNLEQEFSEFPVLIYDGPFSDSTEGKSDFVSNLHEKEPLEALDKINEILKLNLDEMKCVDKRQENGIELFSLEKDDAYIDVTQKGGLLFRFFSSKIPSVSRITINNALNIARENLLNLGFDGMTETYYIKQDNMLTVNYVLKEGDVIIYPDMIKITISLADGDLVNFDASGYIKNHNDRNLKINNDKKVQAVKKISPDLKILSYSPAIIPSEGGKEKMVYEFKCKTKDGQHCIVYINSETLLEEKIFILIENENGTLVM